jgi:hypothetical protein
MIGDVLAYDWVLFQSIFGTAFDMPGHMNYIPVDVSTLLTANSIDPDINREEYLTILGVTLPQGDKHTALYDAKITQLVYNTYNK